MDYLIHIANLLYLVSYLMRDVIRLRVLTVVAASCLIPYFYLQPTPLTAAIGWNLFFIALNVGWIARLVREQAHRVADACVQPACAGSTCDVTRTAAFDVPMVQPPAFENPAMKISMKARVVPLNRTWCGLVRD
jgi:hypothetical protein